MPVPEPLPTPAEFRRAEELKFWEALFRPRIFEATPVLDVVPDPEAEDEEREWQTEVATRISIQAELAGYVPAERLRHFAWINSGTYPPVTGWQGTIQEMRPTPAGLLVRMQVRPDFPGTFMTTVHTVESFLIVDGVVSPMAIEPPDPSKPRVISAQ